jgi:hypothetical protein
MKRPPDDEKAAATGVNAAATLGGIRQTQYSSPVLAALSLFRRINIVSERQAEQLLRGRTPCIEVVQGLPVVGWRTPRGRFVPGRDMACELGHYAVRVPGKSEPIWLLHWSFDPDQFLATYGGLSDAELQRHFPGFDRAAYDADQAKQRKHDEALIEALAFEAAARTFRSFLKARRITNTPSGDFVRDARADSQMPDCETLDELLTYLRLRGACDEAIRAARRLWPAFERWRRP